MTRRRALRTLLTLWAIGTALMSALVFMQVAFGKYGDQSEAALSWLLNAFAPTLALVTTAAFGDASKRWLDGDADKFRIGAGVLLSTAYFVAIGGLILLEPFLPISSMEMFELSSIPLAVWQALTVAAITSVIFDKR